MKFFRHAASTVFASRFARSSANFLRRSCAASWIATRPSRTASGFDLAWAGVWNPKDSCTRYTRAENESPYVSWDYSTVSVQKTLLSFDETVGKIESYKFSNKGVKMCKATCDNCDLRYFCHFK